MEEKSFCTKLVKDKNYEHFLKVIEYKNYEHFLKVIEYKNYDNLLTLSYKRIDNDGYIDEYYFDITKKNAKKFIKLIKKLI